MQTSWPAGSAYFYTVNNMSNIFPLILNAESSGADMCLSPPTTMLQSLDAYHSGGPWAGYSTLLSVYTQWGIDLFDFPDISSVNFYEWQQLRQIQSHVRQQEKSPESWAIATQPAINLKGANIDIAWNKAVAKVTGLSPGVNLTRGSRRATRIYTKLPTVRTICHNQQYSDHDMNISVSAFCRHGL